MSHTHTPQAAPATMHTDPVAALERVIAQCGDNITELARRFDPPIAGPVIHKWLKRGGATSGNCPMLEKISRERVAELGLPIEEVVLCEYLSPAEPWSVLRRSRLTPDQRRMVEEAQQAHENRMAVQQS